jgi:hypothetical protein
MSAIERLVAEGRLREALHDLLTLGPPPAQPVRMPISEALAAERGECTRLRRDHSYHPHSGSTAVP